MEIRYKKKQRGREAVKLKLSNSWQPHMQPLLDYFLPSERQEVYSESSLQSKGKAGGGTRIRDDNKDFLSASGRSK
ncbi:hypothetical protein NQZ68_030579 [Dissostichus eleginoides]|nr:hypothetical protein NQZ68_030579 [Dissostichus eleginoides]